MIKVIESAKEGYAPVIICDHCGEAINNGKGNFLWNPDTESDISETYFTHKGCDRHFRESLSKRGIKTLWMDLDLFILQLVDNTKVDLKRAN